MKNLVSIPIFIIALAVGLFFVYIHNPNKHVVYVYPTPVNINDYQVKDRSGNCYHFESEQVKCPKDESMIEQYIPQN
jgi:hypothetical protein